MKKFGQFLLVSALSAALLAGCGGSKKAESSAAGSSEAKTESMAASGQKLKVVTTIFPEYDWAKAVLGDKAENAELTLLLKSGVDLHSFQPSAEDIAKISEADLFIYVGGESDGWVDDALKEAKNKNMKVINLMEVLGDKAKEEEMKEGMQESEHEHEHSHDKEVSTFEDSEVKDRTLAEWKGDWQSVYPLVKSGALDEAFKEWGEKSDKMTAEEYKAYCLKGFESDIAKINIDGDTISFTDEGGKEVKSAYKYVGIYIQNWSDGTKAAMYRFEAEDKNAGAPIYVEISDHMIEPAKPEHFHLYSSNESFDAIKDLESNWPTFYPAAMTVEEMNDEFAGRDHHEETEYDEHVWLSLKNAELYVNKIAEDLSALDAANAENYKKNAEAYNKQLSELDTQYADVVKNAANKYLLFGDRFPFRYLVDDYGLDYSAAFVGCSADTEASFETVRFLAEKVDEKKLNNILVIENSDQKIANTIQQNTQEKNQKILVLDSMQSVTEKNIADGETYLGVMQKNLEVLKQALQ